MQRTIPFTTETVPVVTTAGKFYPIAAPLELEVVATPTIYFTIQNATAIPADVTISFTANHLDASTTTTVTLSPKEVVVVPCPTGRATQCMLTATERCYLLAVAQEVAAAATPGFNPFSVSSSVGVTRHFDLTGLSARLIAGASLQVAHTQVASNYRITLTVDKPVYIFRGRIKYYVVGEVVLLIGGKYKQDLHITAEQATNLRLNLAATQLPAETYDTRAFRITV